MSVVERTIDKLRRGAAADALKTTQADSTANKEPIGTLIADDVPTLEARHSEPVPSAHRIAINRDALRASGYLPESQQDRRFEDQYRNIKRPLIASAFAGILAESAESASARLIMMASALPGDGKTFTSINLALSMARERDTSVLLVDADTAKPHISRIFGVDAEPGLLDALANPALSIESLVLPTDVRGLSILPAGKSTEGAAELFASAQMKVLVKKLIDRDKHRIVLFDSAPLLVSSESRALATVVGQVALVVRAGKTPRQAVADAIAAVGQAGFIGLVLNEGRTSLAEGMYGYGAYGEYGNYGGNYEAGDAK